MTPGSHKGAWYLAIWHTGHSHNGNKEQKGVMTSSPGKVLEEVAREPGLEGRARVSKEIPSGLLLCREPLPAVLPEDHKDSLFLTILWVRRILGVLGSFLGCHIAFGQWVRGIWDSWGAETAGLLVACGGHWLDSILTGL